ncbi:GAP family protein [Nocardia sp. NPDC024068]|uniref:GAP family protein n=1 Tax=Nocardia sp. NPDC024068 TaxID=3157197 RepID=UPI0033D436C3
MGSVLGDLLPIAVGVAISPIPIVAAILMILSARARGAGLGFAGGWVVGIAVVTVVVTLLAGPLGGSPYREPGAAGSWVKIVLGILLLALAAVQWWHREDTEVPAWMRAVDDLTAERAAGLGVLLSAVNPKNLLLCLSAGVVIGSSGTGGGGQVVAIVVFTLLSASTVLAVILGYIVAADRLRVPLGRLRDWLQDNNHIVLAIVLLLMGVVVLGKGIGGL